MCIINSCTYCCSSIGLSYVEKDKEYWNEVFETIPEIGNIPQIKQEAKNTCKASRKTFVLPKEQIEKIVKEEKK